MTPTTSVTSTRIKPKMLTSSRRSLCMLGSLAALAVASLTACGGSDDSTADDSAPLTFQVGRSSIEWTDNSRVELCGDVAPGTPRRLQAYVWYPATPAAGAKPSALITGAQAALLSQAEGLDLDPAVLASLPSRSYDEAPVDARRSSYPVLLMSQSNAAPSPLVYSSTAESLAAQGYVVVGLSHTFHTGATFFADGAITLGDPNCDLNGIDPPDQTGNFAEREANFGKGQTLDAYLAADAGSAIDKLRQMNAVAGVFRGRLKMDRVGMFGHSFGGSHAFRALRDNPSVAAAANIDGSLFVPDPKAGVAKPFMTVTSGDANLSPEQRALAVSQLVGTGLTAAQANTVFDWGLSLRPAFEASRPAYWVTIPSAKHNNFTDEAIWAAYGLPADPAELNLPEAQAILDLQNAMLAAFFNRHLLGRSGTVALPQTPLLGVKLETRQ